MNLSKEMFEALDLSIQKWEKIYENTKPDMGPSDCALCKAYGNIRVKCCIGCPIYEDTGEPGCQDTPYRAWSAYMKASCRFSAFDKRAKQLALNELNYLRGLKVYLEIVRDDLSVKRHNKAVAAWAKRPDYILTGIKL